MPTKITVYDLLISCPSDMCEYISHIETTINLFNNNYGRANNIIIRTFHWSKSAYPTIGESPQDILNKQIVDCSDMAVGIFWTRFGSPTTEYNSGTEEEIERMVSSNKQVFLYFLDKPIHPSKIDQEQYKKVCEFKERHKQDGIYFSVEDEEQLSKKFYTNLELYFNSIIHGEDIKRKISKEILWVDDRPENNVYERKILEHYGIDISLALTTKQALQFMRNNDFSLVISDMGRKEGDREGYVLLKKIRESDKNIPFIIYAGSRKPEHVREALDKGAQGCTNEPAELVDLVITNLLNT